MFLSFFIWGPFLTFFTESFLSTEDCFSLSNEHGRMGASMIWCDDDKNDILITPSQLCDPSQGCSLSRKPAGWHQCWIVSSQRPTLCNTTMYRGEMWQTWDQFKEFPNVNKEFTKNQSYKIYIRLAIYCNITQKVIKSHFTRTFIYNKTSERGACCDNECTIGLNYIVDCCKRGNILYYCIE